MSVHHRRLLAATLVCVPVLGWAADTDAKPAPSLQVLQEQINALKDQLDDLEQQRKAGGGQRLQFKGFADIQYTAKQVRNDDGSKDTENHFGLGTLDLFMTAPLHERISFMSEVAIEAKEDNSVAVDVERLLLNYNLPHDVTVSAGRYHTTIAVWNDFYHHGEWLNESISRPRVVRFEDGGGLLPSHNVGVQLKGRHDLSADLGIDYTAEIGNGRGHVADPPQLQRDANNAKAVNLQVAFRPLTAVPGLRVGGGLYVDSMAPNLASNPADYAHESESPDHGRISERIITGFAHYQRDAWGILAEYYRIVHTTADGDTPGYDEGSTAVTNAGLVQVSYRIGAWVPYVRGDVANLSRDERYFSNNDSAVTGAVGLRWDVCTWNALKIQLERSTVTAGDPAVPGTGTQDHKDYILRLQTCAAF